MFTSGTRAVCPGSKPADLHSQGSTAESVVICSLPTLLLLEGRTAFSTAFNEGTLSKYSVLHQFVFLFQVFT